MKNSNKILTLVLIAGVTALATTTIKSTYWGIDVYYHNGTRCVRKFINSEKFSANGTEQAFLKLDNGNIVALWSNATCNNAAYFIP